MVVIPLNRKPYSTATTVVYLWTDLKIYYLLIITQAPTLQKV